MASATALRFVRANLAPGQWAVLSGVGEAVAVAARAVGPRGRVIAADPRPEAILRAAESAAPPVRLLLAALGDEAGFARVPGSPLVVPMTTLDAVIGGLTVGPPRLLFLETGGPLAGLSAVAAADIALVAEDSPETAARLAALGYQVSALEGVGLVGVRDGVAVAWEAGDEF